MTHYYESHRGSENKSATILPFERPRLPAKRGRPKSFHKGSDTGTPELVMKRLLGETTETLDLLQERGIISKQQHWCGIHLRWLYSLRFGAPSVRTLNPTETGGIEITRDDPQWREAREAEYQEAIRSLGNGSRTRVLISLCIHNERPRFLTKRPGKKLPTSEQIDTIVRLREGLDILNALWGRER